MKKAGFLLLLLFGSFYLVSAQEQRTLLQGNPQLQGMPSANPNFQKKSFPTPASPLLLPFLEDFSYKNGYPDTSRWTDDNAYINHNFGVRPPSIGVATLDATDAQGRIYSHGGTTAFPADTLTSRPIRLDSVFSPYGRELSIADSVYFSFFYQPGGGLNNHPWEGLGDAPENTDSLILEFGYWNGDTIFSDIDSDRYVMKTVWVPIWSAGGCSLEEFIAAHHLDSGLYFRQVMIPITDQRFFNKGFQFRFRNLASLEYTSDNLTWAGNVDFWNIDYVRLDRGRNCKDTFIDDIAFADNPGSILQHYEAMPWKQFQATELKTEFRNSLINLSNATKNASYQYWITDCEGRTVATYDGGSYNIAYHRPKGYQDYAPHARPSIQNLSLSATGDTASFRIVHLHKEAGSGDVNPYNDTVVFTQVFGNYYAYDDGTPEAGYSVIDINTYHTALALKFDLQTPDSLGAISMYINHTYGNTNDFDFTLCVWNCQNDMPGQLLYSQKVNQEFQEGRYPFQTFYLEKTVALKGSFFIGYELTGRNFLNVGFDQNTNHSEQIRYFSHNRWNESFLAGTPMIRPHFGKLQKPVPVGVGQARTQSGCTVYPNPADDEIHILLPEDMQAASSRLQIFSIDGKCLYNGNYKEEMSTAAYAPGLYLIRITDQQKEVQGKFSVR